jgi:hypothetical protein
MPSLTYFEREPIIVRDKYTIAKKRLVVSGNSNWSFVLCHKIFSISTSPASVEGHDCPSMPRISKTPWRRAPSSTNHASGSPCGGPEYARLQIRPDAATAGAPERSSTTARGQVQPHREFVPIGTQPTSEFPTKRQGPVNWNFDYTKGNARRLSPHVSPS